MALGLRGSGLDPFSHGEFDMKRCQSLLICALAMFGAGAHGSDTRSLPPHVPFVVNSASASADFSAQTALNAGRPQGPSAAQASFGDMVKNLRATSYFVGKQAAKAATPNRWLITLAALGLIVLQLRRKHKSLPQRRIAPYG
jgi:hypothetical protein